MEPLQESLVKFLKISSEKLLEEFREDFLRKNPAEITGRILDEISEIISGKNREDYLGKTLQVSLKEFTD